jgi:hypothetical protein
VLIRKANGNATAQTGRVHTEAEPPTHQEPELLCEDNRGIYVLAVSLPLGRECLVQCCNDAAIEVKVLGWRCVRATYDSLTS